MKDPRWTVAIARLIGAACRESVGVEPPNEPRTLAASPASLFGPTREKTLDERYAEVATTAPEFAGVVVDADGTLAVHVAGTGDGQAAIAAFRTTFGRSASGRAVRAVHVKWSFKELAEAREQVESAAEGLLVSSDIDEARNQVAFVVPDEAALARVRQLVAMLGDRAAAVSVIRGEFPRPASTLSDGVRPVMGGLQVDTKEFGTYCTLSFVVRYYGSGTDYLATNSHCTRTLNALDSPMTLRQPTYWSSDYPLLGDVGSEAVDPSLFTGTAMCGGNPHVCRYSDAALFTVSSVTTAGQIARTTYSASTPGVLGSTTLTSPPFAVSGAWTGNDLYVGMSVHKVGKSSGWTTGTIAETCKRYYKTYSPPSVPQTHSLECQTTAGMTVKGGDSGSPVFTVNSDGTSVQLAGQAWGADVILQDSPDQNLRIYGKVVFSSWTNLQTDLGAIYPKL